MQLTTVKCADNGQWGITVYILSLNHVGVGKNFPNLSFFRIPEILKKNSSVQRYFRSLSHIFFRSDCKQQPWYKSQFSPLGGHIRAPAYSGLNNYVFPFTIAEESQLVDVGYQEHVGLGRRFASRVQELLGGATEAELRLIASTRNRSIDSAKGFRLVMASYLLANIFKM